MRCCLGGHAAGEMGPAGPGPLTGWGLGAGGVAHGWGTQPLSGLWSARGVGSSNIPNTEAREKTGKHVYVDLIDFYRFCHFCSFWMTFPFLDDSYYFCHFLEIPIVFPCLNVFGAFATFGKFERFSTFE